MILGKKLVVVLPAYNAEHTLRRTVDALPPGVVDELVLVDDASRDNTAALARSLGLHVLVHRVNLGYGGNQKTCYTEALARGADIVIMLHPDYQYDPRLVPAMAWLIASGLYDAVLASRIIGNGALRGGMPYYKYVANRLLTVTENILLGEKLSEYHTGYRAFSRNVLETLPLEANSNDFVFDNEMLAQIFYFGFRVGEVSCPTRYEPESSSINFRRSCKYGFGVLWTALQYRAARWGLARPALFAAASPRLDPARTSARLAEPVDSEKGAPGQSGGEPWLAGPSSRVDEASSLSMPDTRGAPPEPAPPRPDESSRWRLKLFLLVLVVATIAPAVWCWALISHYDAIAHVAVVPERDIVFRGADGRTITDGQTLVMDDTGALYLADFGSNRVLAFPDRTSTSGRVFAPTTDQDPVRRPYGLGVSPDGNLLAIDGITGLVNVYDRQGTILRTMQLGSRARLISVDELGRIYVADSGAHRLKRFLPNGEPDPSWGKLSIPGTVAPGPVIGMVVERDRVYIAIPKALIVLNEQGDEILRTQPVGNAGQLTRGPLGTLLMSDEPTSRIWWLDRNMQTIGRVVGADGTQRVVTQPRGLVVTPNATKIYVVNRIWITPYNVQWPNLLS